MGAPWPLPNFRRSLSGRAGWIACALLLLGAGCSHRQTEAQAGIRSQTLLLGNGAEPEDLDPQIVTAYTDQTLVLALFEGLTAIDEKTSTAAPAAAQSWESSANGLIWTFHLRPNLRWSNGDALTADDFIRSWWRILDPALGAEYAYLLFPIRNAEAYNQGKLSDPLALGITAPDPSTVRIELGTPVPYLPILAAQPAWFPINSLVLARFDAMKRRGTAWTRPGSLVGNGAFLLEEWKPNARITVTKNPHYWDASSVSLRRIEFFPMDNPDTEERAFRTGQLHLTYTLPTSKIQAYRRDSPERLRVDPFLQTYFLRFNVKKPPFNNPKVRLALALAIDRQAIADRVLSGIYPAASSLTPPGCGGYTARAGIFMDVLRARRLLAEAGYPEGRGFPVIEAQARNDDLQPRVLEALQAMWTTKLGIRISLVSVEQKTWLQNQQTLNYSISTSGWAGDFPDPVTFLNLFVTEGGNNWTGWGDARYDQYISEAAATVDPKARDDLFQKAETLLLEAAPITPLYFGARAYLIDPAVKGWSPALLGFHRYSLVRLEPTP